jgi:hypothetical protein
MIENKHNRQNHELQKYELQGQVNWPQTSVEMAYCRKKTYSTKQNFKQCATSDHHQYT